jgi:esterase/lipase superfamily enzyme/Leucine-rich repeat (LRR) protein
MNETEAIRRINILEKDLAYGFLDLSKLDSDRLPSELTKLSALRSLDLVFCQNLTDLSALAALTSLQELDISDCGNLSDISPLSRLTALEWLKLEHCLQLSDISPLSRLTSLHTLLLRRTQLSNLDPLRYLTLLLELDLSHCPQLRDLSPLAGLRSLQELDLSGCYHLMDLSPLAGLRSLQELDLSHCPQLMDLSPLAGLRSLQELDLSHCPQLRDLSPLAGLRSLQELDLSECEELSDLSPLAGLPALQKLNLCECRNLIDLSGLEALGSLESLDLRRYRSISDKQKGRPSSVNLTDLSPLRSLHYLKTLDLSWCEKVTDISPLAGLASLDTLTLDGCANIPKFAPLESLLPTLKELYLFHCKMSDLPPDVLSDDPSRQAENVLNNVRAHYNNIKNRRQFIAALEISPSKAFFICYHKTDTAWCQWIAWHLNQAGYAYTSQEWDPTSEAHFIDFQLNTLEAANTIILVSSDFLRLDFTYSQWMVAFKVDPEGEEKRVLPILIKACNPSGFLGSLPLLDFVSLLSEDARTALREALNEVAAAPNSVAPSSQGPQLLHSDAPPDYPGPSKPESSLPPLPTDGQDPKCKSVLFATNRRRHYFEHPETDRGVEFTHEKNHNLTYGFSVVRVPTNHNIGEAKRPKALSFFGLRLFAETENDSEHFTLRPVIPLSQKQFEDLLQRGAESSALVFVHGYKTDFKDAVCRLAQIVYDTQYTGIPVAFSWPSMGRLKNYDYDRESALFSRRHFLHLLELLAKQANISNLYVVAHSLGNQIVVDALADADRMDCFAPRKTEPDAKQISHPLSEIIFAAPDVDKDVFIERTAQLKSIARGITLYASSADKALLTSAFKAQGPRAGYIYSSEPLVIPGIETIDVTAVGEDMFALNHDTLSKRDVIDDVGRLIVSGTHPPHIRSPQIRKVPEGSATPKFWRYPR